MPLEFAFQSPQWGSNSKGVLSNAIATTTKSFSPRNGEVILKDFLKEYDRLSSSFSPRNGEVILKSKVPHVKFFIYTFQSPQWGSNSKVQIKWL